MSFKTNPEFKLPIFLSFAVFIMAALFKIMHWSGANYLFIFSLPSIALFYALRFLKKADKKFLDYVKVLLVISWCMSSLFTIMHWPFSNFLNGISSLLFTFWLAIDGLNYIFGKEEKSKINTIARIVSTSSFIFIIVGAMFKIMHWPYANVLLIIGLTSSTLYFIAQIWED